MGPENSNLGIGRPSIRHNTMGAPPRWESQPRCTWARVPDRSVWCTESLLLATGKVCPAAGDLPSTSFLI